KSYAFEARHRSAEQTLPMEIGVRAVFMSVMTGGYAAQHDADSVGAGADQSFIGEFQLGSSTGFSQGAKQRAIGGFRGHQRLAGRKHRRRIDDDVAIVRAEM